MRILVTGGAGFIGSHIVDAYVQAGHHVIVVDSLQHGFKKNVHPAARFYRVDVRNQTKLQQIFITEKPDVVNHHAALSEVVISMRDPDTTLDVNVLGTANVLRCATLAGTKKIIFASTGGTIYGNAKQLPTKETAPLEPISAYAASKQLGENWIQYYHRAFGLHYTIFRYGNVFGVRQDPHGEAGVVAIFAQQLSQHQPTTIFGQGDKTRDYIYIPDVVAANILALQSGNDQIYNLGLGKPISDQVVYTTIAQHFPQSGKPHFKNIRAGEVMHTYINATKARRDLGWKPHWSFATGVADYVETI